MRRGKKSTAEQIIVKLREAEVFGLIGDGLGTREITERLALYEHTVHTHRNWITAKLGTTGDDLTRRTAAHHTKILRGHGG